MLSGSSAAARMLTPSPSVLVTRKIISGGSVGVSVTVGVPVAASSVAVRVDVASVEVAVVAVRVDIASVGVPGRRGGLRHWDWRWERWELLPAQPW